jgi:omega-amidase
MRVTISLAQIQVAPGDPATNLKKAEECLAEAARRGSELLVLPELWTTGVDWQNVKVLLAGQSVNLQTIGNLAKKYGMWLTGSFLAADEQGRPTNTSVLFDPQGQQAGLYRKIHLFGLMHEDQYLAPGQQLTTVETLWGRVGLAICYDVRFPEMFRAYALAGVDLVCLPAAWPHPRLNHWRTLQRARAIENQMYVAAVNQVGSDGKYEYCGHSAIIDPWGETVVEAGATELLLTATIDIQRVTEVRQKMPVLKDRRPDVYRLDK